MRDPRSLSFDALETRQLLSKAHHAPVPEKTVTGWVSPPAQVAGTLALAGTLVVNNKASTILTDDFGDQTTQIPVAGTLTNVGVVHGYWDESVDANGNYLGPDSIQLHNSKGTFVLGFDATTLGQGVPTAQGTTYPGATLALDNGTGAYNGATDSGYLQENTNARHMVVESLTLSS